MKKYLMLTLALVLVLSGAGCGKEVAELSDWQLLEITYYNMQNLQSSRSSATLILSTEGFELEPMQYDVWTTPDKTYMEMKISTFGEEISYKVLVQGEQVQVKAITSSGEELEEIFQGSMAQQAQSTQQFEDMFLQLADTVNFTLISNPQGFAEKDFKTYKLALDSAQLKDIMEEVTEDQLREALAESAKDLEDEDIDWNELQTLVEQMLTDMEIEMEATVVIDTKNQYFKQLTMNVTLTIPLPAFDDEMIEDMPTKITTISKITIDYLEVNADLQFPAF